MKHFLSVISLISFLLPTFIYADDSALECIKELEEVPFVYDANILKDMGRTVKDHYTTWDLLSGEDGKGELEASLERKAEIGLPSRRRRKRDSSEVYDMAKKSTLIVGRLYTCGKCSKIHFRFTNTAFAITEDGVCVMNFHCVEAFRNKEETVESLHGYVVRTWDGNVYPMSAILSGNEDQDLILVKVTLPEGEKLTPLPLGTSANVGDTVYTLSHPKGMFYRFSKGMVNRNSLNPPIQKGGTPRPRMSISADYAVGSSGGPVLDSRGNVVGVISTTRTLYATKNRTQGHAQMVDKATIPVASLRELVAEED